MALFLAQANGARLPVCSECLAAIVLLATCSRWVLLAVLFLAQARGARLAVCSECLAAIVLLATCDIWVPPAVLFLAQALLARLALGIVCRAANWCLPNCQGLSLRRQDNHAEEEPHEEVLFGFPIGGC